MSRDHSETCGRCGFQRGGLNDLECCCDLFDGSRLANLAHNVAIAGALCASFRAGDNFGFHMGSDESQCMCQWAPGHGSPYKGWTRCERDAFEDEQRCCYGHDDEDEPFG